MWTAQLPRLISSAKSKLLYGYAGASILFGLFYLTACSAPVFPDNKPTKSEVPFLGTQLTQEAINSWSLKVDQQRQKYKTQWSNTKRSCYQRFFVNACLRKALETYRKQTSVLRKQNIELNRQRRVLQEIDRQLRLKENQIKLQQR